MTPVSARMFSSTVLAVTCLLGLGSRASAAHVHRDECPHLSPEERAELRESLSDLGLEMGRLGAEIAREVARGLEDVRIEGGDWADLERELRGLGEEVREELHRELKDAGLDEHIRERMQSEEWREAVRELREAVREIAREARNASREAARAAREARQDLHERHEEHPDRID